MVRRRPPIGMQTFPRAARAGLLLRGKTAYIERLLVYSIESH